ncbi:hypothetical protein BDP27DRAFT_1410263 [Rhodocollybia butyracea]|uniref:MYND-type domain-containing protein n=1 Tax=Rhodocollybia butyracea TaxID=206335 RepID=A0A9P5P5I7_9AGAR|nr:hypothetical protein BDP27DRAFT_1410263 [Rhodocollybia butyracea]
MSRSQSSQQVPKRDNSHLPNWVGTFDEASSTGLHALKDNLHDQRVEVKQAKLRCNFCGKAEDNKKPLQCCSLCRTVHYCDRTCQVAHYKPVHKSDCKSFRNIPLCRSFTMDRILPGCKYPESVVFAKGHQEGIGCWVSTSGQIDCTLFQKAGNPLPSKDDASDDNPKTMMDALEAFPFGRAGAYLGLRVMVQNRRQADGKVVVIGNEILAVCTPRGADVLLEGMKPGETNVKIPSDLDNSQPLIGLKQAYIKLENFNGKEVKRTLPALIDGKACSVALSRGDYAIFSVHFRVGGPRITLDFQALEKIAHIQVPWLASDSTPPSLSPKDRKVTKAPMDHSLVASYFEDYRSHGEEAFITSHHGEARAKMISAGQDAVVSLLKQMAIHVGGGGRSMV